MGSWGLLTHPRLLVLWVMLSYSCSRLEKDQSLTLCRLVRVGGRMLLGVMGGLELPVVSQMLLCLMVTVVNSHFQFNLLCISMSWLMQVCFFGLWFLFSDESFRLDCIWVRGKVSVPLTCKPEWSGLRVRVH